MTHTLHRVGDKESLEGEYLLYMVPSRGINAKNSTPKIKKFLDICEKYNPVNIGCLFPSSEKAQPKGFLRGNTIQDMKNSVVDRTETIVTFSDKGAVKNVLNELREADLGISVVVSGIFNSVFQSCNEAGLTPHTMNISLGIWGKAEGLPQRKYLDLVTMCGHGLVSPFLAEDLVNKIREGKISAEDAGRKLGVNCVCGAFNHSRAAEILKQIVANG